MRSIALTLLLSCSAPALVNVTLAQVPPTFVQSWGGTTLYSGASLADPTGLTVDATGQVYVSDRANNRILKFSSTGTYLMQIPIETIFPAPAGMCVDQAGNLYVACTGIHQIRKYSPTGTELASFGSPGTGPLQFQYPYAVVVDAQGNIYVGDKDNDRIQKLTPQGGFLEEWNGTNTGAGTFRPTHMRLSPTGYIFVVDGPRHRVLTFSLTGNLLRDQPMTDPCTSTSGAGGLAVDGSGQYILGSFHGNCVSEYSSSGTPVLSWGSFGTGPGQFDQLDDLDLSPNGSLLYVLEGRGRRVQVFLRPTPIPVVPTTWSRLKTLSR